MSQPPFGDPGVCPTIALFSLSTNQSPIGGSLSTTSFRLRRMTQIWITEANSDKLRFREHATKSVSRAGKGNEAA
jgi:hypothetical protein